MENWKGRAKGDIWTIMAYGRHEGVCKGLAEALARRGKFFKTIWIDVGIRLAFALHIA